MNAEERILMDFCRSTNAAGLLCRAEIPEAVTIGGELRLKGNRIREAADPEAPGDVLTKGYADRNYSRLRLLWENPAANAPFAPGTIPLDLSDCCAVMIAVQYHTAAENCGCSWLPVGASGACRVFSEGEWAARNCTVTPEGILFQAGLHAEGADNAFAIPVKIYGV